MDEDRIAWIRGEIRNGESPDRIIDDLMDAGWTESGAEEAVWAAIGTGFETAEPERRPRDLLALGMSALALVISLGVAAMVITGQGPIASPVDSGGDGIPVANGSPTGDDPGSNVVTLDIQEGVLSAPSQRVTPLPARLHIVNADNRSYTVESSGLGFSDAVQAYGELRYDISAAGTYTVSLRQTGESVSFQVE